MKSPVNWAACLLRLRHLLSKKKTKEIALARQVGMYLVLEMMSLPQLTVGKIFGRDHATVIYARDKITEQMETDTRLSVEVNDIKKKILKQVKILMVI